jgi:hypothetical protein
MVPNGIASKAALKSARRSFGCNDARPRKILHASARSTLDAPHERRLTTHPLHFRAKHFNNIRDFHDLHSTPPRPESGPPLASRCVGASYHITLPSARYRTGLRTESLGAVDALRFFRGD